MMESGSSQQLLIYHPDSKAYEELILKRLPELKIHSATSPQEAYGFIEEVEIILSWQIPDDLLIRARRLRWFASMAAGNEDLIHNPHLPEEVVLTKSTIYGGMMAEYVFAYLLYFTRNIGKYLKDQREKVWDRMRPERLKGKVMGLLGLGSVGKEVAKRAKQFEMGVFGMKRTPEPVENVDQVFGPWEIERMIPLVDYLILALPLTSETYHMIGEKEFRLMKEGTIFINIGRGKTVDEKALIRFLKNGRIKAVLDVFEEEPLAKESELWDMENVIVTPHVSGINLPNEICEEFVKNFERWARGEPLASRVDRKRGY